MPKWTIIVAAIAVVWLAVSPHRHNIPLVVIRRHRHRRPSLDMPLFCLFALFTSE